MLLQMDLQALVDMVQMVIVDGIVTQHRMVMRVWVQVQAPAAVGHRLGCHQHHHSLVLTDTR